MCFETLNRKLKNGYKAFCEETSMHGFLELYRAKNCFWKTVWFVLIVACFGITGFQLYGSIKQYIDQTTVTSIQPATKNDIIYPPLKYCINHWLFWFYFSEDLLKFMSKPTLLLALNRISSVYTDQPFDVSKSESDLIKVFKEKQNAKFGITSNYNDFFIKNSKDLETFNAPFTVLDKELVFIEKAVYMCYTLNETVIQSLLSEEKLKLKFRQSTQDYRLDEFNLLVESTFFTKQNLWLYYDDSCLLGKFSGLCGKYVSNYINDENSTLFNMFLTIFEHHPSDLLLVDGFNKQPILLYTPYKTYTIQLRLAVEKWLPDGQKKCNPNVQSLFSKTTCSEKCKYLSYTYKDDQNVTTPCKNLDTLIFLQEEASMEKVCRNYISFQYDYSFIDQRILEVQGTSQEIIFEECMDSCYNGCDKWKYEQSVFASEFPEGNDAVETIAIIIQYPAAENVLVLKELERKTWEDFVSNVGGLLGIWTGASILSLLQLIYLFCCVSHDTASYAITVVPKLKVRNNNKKTTKITAK